MLDMLDYVGYSFVIALGTVALFKTSTVHNKEGERHEQIIPNLDRCIRRQLQTIEKLWQQGLRRPGHLCRKFKD